MADRVIVLLAHGSPDPRWRLPVEELCERIRVRTGATVRPAYLGPGAGSLEDVVDALVGEGAWRVEVVAHFLSAGGKHVAEEIPARLRALGRAHPELELILWPGALGEHPAVLDAMADVVAEGQP